MSDHGSQFVSSVISELMKLLVTHHNVSVAYLLLTNQENAIAERSLKECQRTDTGGRSARRVVKVLTVSAAHYVDLRVGAIRLLLHSFFTAIRLTLTVVSFYHGKQSQRKLICLSGQQTC